MMAAIELELIEAAGELAGLMESLAHPKHAAALMPRRARMERFLRLRWKKQKRALISHLNPWLKTMGTRYAEADTTIVHGVKVAVNGSAVFDQDASDKDVAAFDRIVQSTADAAVARMAIDYQITVSKDAAQRAARAYLADRGFAKLAGDIDATSKQRIVDALVETFEGGGTYSDAVAAIKGTMDGFSESRAEMIARTELNDAYNQTILDSAKEIEGAKKEWSPDGEACPICMENVDAGPIDLDEDFPSGDDAPTAHPNAVFAGSTFVPYGDLKRMVAAEYDGLAIALQAGEYKTTIGPNHPLLTARGLIPAKLIQIGDQLVCDRRMIGIPAGTSQSDFDQVESVEDSFAAVSAAFGYARIAPTADDLHGDAMFCKEKVQVVFPKGELLRKLEPLGVERLRERGLVDSDVHLSSEANTCFLDEQLHRFLLPSTGSVSRSDVCHYDLLTVKATRETRYQGSAFDATTGTGLYCSDGFVVSNCDCSLSIILPEAA